jgi:hypothetical protein
MGKLKVDGCIRCKKGDVALDKDQYGWYEYCLQCGYMRELSGAFNTVAVKNKAALKSHRSTATL